MLWRIVSPTSCIREVRSGRNILEFGSGDPWAVRAHSTPARSGPRQAGSRGSMPAASDRLRNFLVYRSSHHSPHSVSVLFVLHFPSIKLRKYARLDFVSSFSRLAGATMRCQEPPPRYQLHRLSVGRAAAGRLVCQCAAYSKAFARGRRTFLWLPDPLISSLNASEIAPRKFHPHFGRHLRP